MCISCPQADSTQNFKGPNKILCSVELFSGCKESYTYGLDLSLINLDRDSVASTNQIELEGSQWSGLSVSVPCNLKVPVCCVLNHFYPALCDPMNCSLPDSSVHGILQARMLEWVPFPLPGNLPNPGIEPRLFVSSELSDGFFTTSANWK